ncbi:hypothetical protein BH23BAC1_BH23BAC1_15120 [soil metagenome]
MKNSLIIFIYSGFFILLFAWPQIVSAQEERGRRAQIESAKIALITQRMQLTPQEAEKFWPVYNEYQQEKENIRRQIVRGRQSEVEEVTEQQALDLIRQRQDLRRQELALDEKYYDQMIQVTSARQVMALSKAESEFRRILLQRLRRRN